MFPSYFILLLTILIFINMKYFIFLAVFCLLAVSCSNENEDKVMNQQALVPVTVSVNDFSITQGEFPDAPGEAQGTTRATAVGEYNGLKTLTLAFYDGETEVYKATQLKESMPEGATFGNFSLDLPLGSYTMVVLGYVLYDDDALTLTSPTQAEYTVNAPRETFAATQTVNVTSTTALNLSATLNRIVSQLKVISSDNRTANVEKVRMTFAAGGKRFSPTSGLATVNTGFSNTVGIGTAVGARSGSVSNLFLDTDEQDIDVTIETLDADGNTVFSTVVHDVPFKRNRITKLTGAIYDVSASATAGSFEVNTEWLDDYSDTF